MADSQVRSSEIDSEVGTLLLSSGPTEDEGRKHGLESTKAFRVNQLRNSTMRKANRNLRLLDPSS